MWVCQRKREIGVGRRDVKSEKRETKKELATAVAHIGRIRYSSTGYLIRNRNSNPSWVSYVREDALYTKFSIAAPEFLIRILVNPSLGFVLPCFILSTGVLHLL